MNDLAEKIQECLALKEGNKEFALFYVPSNDSRPWGCSAGWWVEIGNPVDCVNLGESSGEVRSVICPTALDAVSDLLAKLRNPANVD